MKPHHSFWIGWVTSIATGVFLYEAFSVANTQDLPWQVNLVADLGTVLLDGALLLIHIVFGSPDSPKPDPTTPPQGRTE